MFLFWLIGAATGVASATATSEPPVPPVAVLKGKERRVSPIGNPGDWITRADYPPAALRQERTGLVTFMLQVGKDGRVSNCTVTAGSGSPDLDSATCTLITARAQFLPALDKVGKPTESLFASRVRWAIPPREVGPQPLPKPGSAKTSFTVQADGKVTDCISETSGSFQAIGVPSGCANLAKTFAPAKDASGNVIAQKVVIEMSIKSEQATAP